jgi:hypothetical protein
MGKNLTKYLFIILSLFVFNCISNAQSFGFGCLGLSGFYAGYSQQDFSTPAINDYVYQQNTLADPLHAYFTDQIDFKRGTGYRVGVNFFRAKFSGLFISAKGYYQFLRELHDVSAQMPTGLTQEKYQLTMNHWGVGIDFGINLFWILDWKIVEGDLTFFNSDFTREEIINNNSQGVIDFNPGKNKMGYFIGSGLILQIVPDYVSVEGTVGYNFIQIDKMTAGSGLSIPAAPSNSPSIQKGSISVTIQLNVGFPL